MELKFIYLFFTLSIYFLAVLGLGRCAGFLLVAGRGYSHVCVASLVARSTPQNDYII